MNAAARAIIYVILIIVAIAGFFIYPPFTWVISIIAIVIMFKVRKNSQVTDIQHRLKRIEENQNGDKTK